MYYKFHSKDPWLKSVLALFWAFQLVFLLALVASYVWVIAYAGYQSTDTAVFLVISGISIVLVVTEIILFTANRLHPLAYLILQLGKTITWFVLFTQAAVDTAGDAAQGYTSSTSTLEYALTTELIEDLVLFLTFLAALIYASITYHRHRLAKTNFLHAVLGPDLFPVPSTHEVGHENRTPPTPHPPPPAALFEAPIHPATATAEPKTKEAIEVTVLRELGGGDWNVYELPATRSVRNSRGESKGGMKGEGSVRSLMVV